MTDKRPFEIKLTIHDADMGLRPCDHRQHGGTLVRMDARTFRCEVCGRLFKLGAMAYGR